MRYLDVCAGISASSVAWKPLGWEAAAYSEIEPAPRAILAHRQGAIPVGWDHRHAPGSNITPLFGDFTQIEAHHVGPIDLLVGGTPCQDFSVAGLRAGLDGDRGNLSLEFLRLADRTRPRWLVWENVPGVLSISGGRAFGAILGGMGELGYGFAYRVLDAQHFGVPQRRRRVFVVGYLGDHRRAGAVLFERHSLSGHPAPRREAGKGAPTIPSRSLGGGGLGTDFDCDGGLIQQAYGGGNTSGPIPVAAALAAHGRRQDFEVETFITHAIQERAVSGNLEAGPQGKGFQEGIAYTLEARHHVHAVAFTSKDHGQDVGQLSPTLRSMSGKHANAGGQVAIAYAPDVTATLVGRSSRGGGQTNSPGHNADQAVVASASAVRRLTPRECERLQGFPDDYTLVPNRGKPMADGPRYKALGNSMAVPVMRWIGERIAAVDALPMQKDLAA